MPPPLLRPFAQRLVNPGEISRENIANNQQLADVLMASSMRPQPIEHWTQGMAQLMNAMNSQLYRQRATRGSEALKAQEATQLGNLLQSLSLDPSQQALLSSMPQDAQMGLATQAAAQRLMPQPGEQFTLGAGQTRFGPDGRPIASLPESSSSQTPEMLETLLSPDGTSYRSFRRGDPQIDTLISQGWTEAPTRQETGTPGGFKTDAQRGQDLTAFQDAVLGAAGAVRSATELVDIARNNPEALGSPGLILRVGNEFVRTAGALLGTAVDANMVNPDRFNFDTFGGGRFREAAIESQAFRAGILGVAFAAAVAEQGQRPTDRDIQAFVDQIGGSTADPQGFARTMQQFVTRINHRVRDMAVLKSIPSEAQQSAFGILDPVMTDFQTHFQIQNDLSPQDQAELDELRRQQGVR